ncbi:DUF4446 family protein [Candidatus Parcubacteria bacterium]|nr:DUF4446 family protein [Candidatus Parcubacteria bacterium]
MNDFFIYYIIILGILIALNIALIVLVSKLKKRLDAFLKNGKQDIGAVLAEQIQKSQNQEKNSKKMFEKIARLQEISNKSFQKIGIKRYSPFSEVGGDQSFSLCLLDSQNNGFIITSHFGRDFNRIYAKPINQGACKHPLSKEEKETIAQAINEL